MGQHADDALLRAEQEANIYESYKAGDLDHLPLDALLDLGLIDPLGVEYDLPKGALNPFFIGDF